MSDRNVGRASGLDTRRESFRMSEWLIMFLIALFSVMALFFVGIAVFAVTSRASETKEVCITEKVVRREVCNEDKHPILGAGLGWMIFGPLGAVAGAVAGSNPGKHCSIIEERECIEWKKPLVKARIQK